MLLVIGVQQSDLIMHNTSIYIDICVDVCVCVCIYSFSDFSPYSLLQSIE